MHAYYYTFKYMHKRVLGDAGCKIVQFQNPISIQQYMQSMVPLRYLSYSLKMELGPTDFFWNEQSALKPMGILSDDVYSKVSE